jgi:Ca2+-binding RTX toxin-like protein
MTSITITGARDQTAVLSYDPGTVATLASQIANAINSAVFNGTERAAGSNFGPPPPLGGAAGLFVQSQPGVSTMPRGYGDVALSAGSGIIFGSGDPNERILAGTGNLTFYATGGSGTVAAGDGNDLISIPVTDTGSWLIALGNGNDTVIARAGADTIGLGTGHNAVTLGGGTYDVTSLGSDTITAGSGPATIDASRVAAGSSEVIYAGSGDLLFLAGAGSATVFGGSGSETVTGGSGSLVAYGGSAGNNSLTGSLGATTLFGAGSGDTLTAVGSGPALLVAGAGNETLTAAAATGADTFQGGSGQATVFASPTAPLSLFAFVDGAAGGSMLVNDLTSAAQVRIHLTGYGPNEAANALAGQTSGTNSVTVRLSDSTTITFADITHLTSSNFS